MVRYFFLHERSRKEYYFKKMKCISFCRILPASCPLLAFVRGNRLSIFLKIIIIKNVSLQNITRPILNTANASLLQLTLLTSFNFLLLNFVGNLDQKARSTYSLGIIPWPAIFARVPFNIWIKSGWTSCKWRLSLLRGGLQRNEFFLMNLYTTRCTLIM